MLELAETGSLVYVVWSILYKLFIFRKISAKHNNLGFWRYNEFGDNEFGYYSWVESLLVEFVDLNVETVGCV